MEKSTQRSGRFALWAMRLLKIYLVYRIIEGIGFIVWMICAPDGGGMMTTLGQLRYPQTTPKYYPIAIFGNALTVVSCGLLLPFANALRDIFEGMREGATPFVARNTRRYARCLAALAVITAVRFFMSVLFFFLQTPFTVGIDLLFLVFAAIAYALMHIFQYGAALQTLEDETL